MVVLITGASRGIGFETVKYFARQKNTEIFAVSRNSKGLGQLATECAGLNKTSQVHPLVFDLEKLINEPETFLKRLPANIQHVDILINNAGLLINRPFTEFAANDIEQLLRINFIAPALLIKSLMPLMGGKSDTHVVNISSMGGFQGSVKFQGLSFYSASKAALTCLTECLGEEYKNKRVHFNCLALGSVQTEMLEEAFPGYKASMQPKEMAGFIGHFALTAYKNIRGKVIPVSITNP